MHSRRTRWGQASAALATFTIATYALQPWYSLTLSEVLGDEVVQPATQLQEGLGGGCLAAAWAPQQHWLASGACQCHLQTRRIVSVHV